MLDFFSSLDFLFCPLKRRPSQVPQFALEKPHMLSAPFLTLFANAEQISMRKQWETFLPHKNFYTMLCTHFNGKLSFSFFYVEESFCYAMAQTFLDPHHLPSDFFYHWVLCTKYLLNKRVRRKKPSWSQS